MAALRRNSVLSISKALFACCLMLTIAGCSHRVLTVFFTGVPDPNAPVVAQNAAETMGIELTEVLSRDIPPQEHFTHGPWVNRQCQLCHVAPGGQKFNAVTTSANSQARLTEPGKDLCHACHSDQKFTGSTETLWRHGPVANGSCTTCHNPHKSRRQFMLLDDDNRSLCGNCHSGEAAPKGKPHNEDTNSDCVTCHDPHASRSPMLLRAVLTQ